MNEQTLTKEERLCLQAWFRQAIAKVEQDEVTALMLKTYGDEETTVGHRTTQVRRRSSRGRLFSQVRQLV